MSIHSRWQATTGWDAASGLGRIYGDKFAAAVASGTPTPPLLPFFFGPALSYQEEDEKPKFKQPKAKLNPKDWIKFTGIGTVKDKEIPGPTPTPPPVTPPTASQVIQAANKAIMDGFQITSQRFKFPWASVKAVLSAAAKDTQATVDAAIVKAMP